MVRAEMSLDGLTYLYVFARRGMTEARYRRYILEPIVRSYEGAIGDAFILMQGNARAHTADMYTTFLEDNQCGQERNLLVVPIVSKTMSEANSFTPSTDNEHRSACCQKHGSFSGPAASIVSFNCEGFSEAK